MMKLFRQFFFLPFMFLSIPVLIHAQFQKSRIDSIQESVAGQMMDSLEKGNSNFLFSMMDSVYQKSNRVQIEKKGKIFKNDYGQIKSRSRRYSSMILPEGINIFRFRYIGDSGVLLQADLSFKKDINVQPLIKVDISPAGILREQRKRFNPEKKPVIKSYLNQLPDHSVFIDLRNCSNEKKTVTFAEGISFFEYWVLGQTSLAQNKTVHFSKGYSPDTNFLRTEVYDIRKNLPPDFWTFPIGSVWYDYTPGEKGIWFIRILAHEDKAGHLTLYAAYKVTFEGTDARIDAQRANPKIINVEFITAKENLILLEKILRTSAKKVM